MPVPEPVSIVSEMEIVSVAMPAQEVSIKEVEKEVS